MKKLNVKTFLGLVLGVGIMVGVTYASKALTESETRTALAAWMKGDSIVPNPFTAVLDFVAENSLTVVDTYAALASVNGARRVDGSLVMVRGNLSSTGTGGGLYYYASASAASTNLHSSIANTSGGRFLALQPIRFAVQQDWDPPSVNTGVVAYFTFTNFLGLPQPVPGDVVMASHTAVLAASSNLLMSASVNAASNVIVTITSGAAAIDLGTGAVHVAYWKR